MEKAVIRRADTGDRELLCRLYWEFHEFHVRGVPDRLLSLGELPDSFEGSELYQALESIIHGDDSAILVAEVSGQPVGLAEVYLRDDEASLRTVPYRYGYLQSLIVHEPFRQQGIGRRLLASAQTWAKARGATEMRLRAWEFPESSLPFYEGLGYRTLRRTLVLEL